MALEGLGLKPNEKSETCDNSCFFQMNEPWSADAAADVLDVARHIVKARGGSIAQLKLHKLLFYCQAASLAWREIPLFSSKIEAWAFGPVVPKIWSEFPYRGIIRTDDFTSGDGLSDSQKSTIAAVLNAYGEMSGYELSAQTHREDPWRNARGGLTGSERGSRPIPEAEIGKYYRQKWAS